MNSLLILLTLASSIKLVKARERKLDTLAYLNTIVTNKAHFTGKPFSVLADSFKINSPAYSNAQAAQDNAPGYRNALY